MHLPRIQTQTDVKFPGEREGGRGRERRDALERNLIEEKERKKEDWHRFWRGVAGVLLGLVLIFRYIMQHRVQCYNLNHL